MKIGEKFKYRHSGAHLDCILEIRYNQTTKQRYLYDISCDVEIGAVALLYAEKIYYKPTCYS